MEKLKIFFALLVSFFAANIFFFAMIYFCIFVVNHFSDAKLDLTEYWKPIFFISNILALVFLFNPKPKK